MQTERLYQENGHLKECEATVLDCRKTDFGYDILLDRTVVFDNEGGQPCDLGKIGDAVILGCDNVNGEILHHVDKALVSGKTYPVEIDWTRRFDFMQQHTGEHILSYAAYNLFGVNNVGFHLSQEYTTIDLDRMLTAEELQQAEQLANSYVHQNLPVRSYRFETEEELGKANLPVRKHAEGLHTPIRIVQIENCDCCTCCAPHCLFTGEVGLILLKDWIAYKGGIRITFLCGKRALDYAESLREHMTILARQYSTSFDQVCASSLHLQEDCRNLHKTVREQNEELNRYLAEELLNKAEKIGKYTLVFDLLDHISQDRLKSLAEKTLKNGKTLTVLLLKGTDRLSYILTCTKDCDFDLGNFCQAVNAATGGKGGGRGQMAQGTSSNLSGLPETRDQLKNYFIKALS